MITEKKDWIRVALHDLCQPLTALECRLYLATLEAEDLPEPHSLASAELRILREAVRDALLECERMMVLVREMQERLNQKEQG
jgi:hypothetical protein